MVTSEPPPDPDAPRADPAPAVGGTDPALLASFALSVGAGVAVAAGAPPTVAVALLGAGVAAQLASIARLRARRREAALERDRDRAQHSERLRRSEARTLDATGRLAAKVGHEFNNLLAVIAGDAAALVEDPAVDREALAAALQASVRRGAVLTNQLLAFGRKHVVRPERLDLSLVVGHYVELFAGSFPPGVRVERDLAQGASVMADRTEIEQILHALCVNAVLAMPHGGRLVLRTRVDDAAQPPRCVIEVEDQGAGMDEATQARLFEPFFSTRSNGAGLGLVTTRTIVERYGGSVTLRSAPGAGTLARVCLPRLDDSLARAAGARMSLPGGRTVLVVDDEALVRRSIVRPLERAGFVVREAEDGVAALDALRQDPSVCVVVSDVLMPRMDGITLARQLREQQVPVILVSGYADIVASGDPLGAPMLAKPFSPRDLVALVRRAAGTSVAPRGTPSGGVQNLKPTPTRT